MMHAKCKLLECLRETRWYFNVRYPQIGVSEVLRSYSRNTTFQSLHMSYSECFTQTEAALAALNDIVALIVKQLDTVQSKSRTPIPCEVPHASSKSPNPSLTYFMKPAAPDDFGGDWDKGCMFLNLCDLYFALALHWFQDNATRILLSTWLEGTMLRPEVWCGDSDSKGVGLGFNF